MAAITETLSILLDFKGEKAIGEMKKAGATAERELGKASDSSKRLGNTMMATGATMVASGLLITKALGSMGDDFVNAGKEAFRLQRLTGDTVEEASRLRFVAQQTGVGVDSLANGLKFLGKNMEAGKKSFQELGIATKDGNGEFRNTHDVLFDVADAFASMDDGAQKTAYAVQIFGKQGADLLPMLNRGGQALQELAAQADKYGLVLTAQNATSIKEYIRNQRELEATMQGLKVQIGSGVVGALNSMLGPIKSVVGTFQQLSPEARNAIGSVGMFGGTALVVAGSGATLIGMLVRLKASMQAAKESGGALGGLSSSLGAVSIAVAGVTAAWGIWNQKMAEGKEMADKLGDTVQNKVGRSSFGEASNYLQTLNGQINDLHGEWVAWDNDMKSKNPLDNLRALANSDYINEIGDGSQALLQQRDALIKMIDAAHQKAQADGISIDQAWQQVQAEERLKKLHETNPDLTDEEARSMAGLGDEYGDAAKKADELHKAQDRLFSDMLDAIGAQQSVEQAWSRVNDALGTLNQLQREGKMGTAEYANAMRDLRDTSQSYAKTVADKAAADAAAQGQELSKIEYARIYRDKLQEMIDKFPALKNELAGWLAMANTQVTTQWLVRLGVSEDSPLLGLLNQMANLPKSATPLDDIRAAAAAVVGRRAQGGSVRANEPYLVGERGPEIVVPGKSGTVIPNNKLGGSAVPSTTMNINLDGQQIGRVMIDWMRREAYASVG